jgi:hypothetical protein
MHSLTLFAFLFDEALPGEQIVGGLALPVCGVAGLWMAGRQFARCRRLRAAAWGTVGATADGLVRIRGRARCKIPLRSPLSAAACCYHRVEIDQDRSAFEPDGGPCALPNSWRRIYSESSSAEFVIDDGRTRTAVRPKGLELDVTPAMHREIAGSGRGRDEALLGYLKRKRPGPMNALLSRIGGGSLPDALLERHPQRQTNGTRSGSASTASCRAPSMKSWGGWMPPVRWGRMPATCFWHRREPAPRSTAAGSGSRGVARAGGGGMALFGLLLLIFR